MIKYLFVSIVIVPLIEYIIHRGLHIIKNKTHKNHHIEVYQDRNKIEYLPLIIAFVCYNIKWNLVCFGFLQYWLIHTLIHFYPRFLPKFIVDNHIRHHNNHWKCFAVSNPYIDILFGTNI